LAVVVALAGAGCVAAPMDAADESIGESRQAVTTTITTLAQLRAMTSTGNYELGANIDASATATSPFVPVGSFAAPFKGTFDGKGFTIDKLTIKAGGWYVGMFAITSGATLQNIKLTNVKVANSNANSFTGAIVGMMGTTNLSNSQVSGSIAGGSSTGALAGGVSSSSIVGCSVSSHTISGTTSTGGMVGQLSSSSSVVNSSSTGGSVTGTDGVGGLVGSINASNVSFSTASGLNVTGTTNTGGIVGKSTGGGLGYDSASGTVKGSDATGGIVGSISDATVSFGSASNITVTAGTNTGGLVGVLTRSGVTTSNASGSVVGTTNTGGLVGKMVGSVTSRATIWKSYIDDKSANNPSTVQGGTPVGMAVGLVQTYCDLGQSYAIGTLSGASTRLGGFIGEIVAPGPVEVDNNPQAQVIEIYTKVVVNPTFDSGTGAVYAGGLVGRMLGAYVEDINIAGSVKGRTYVGGSVGYVFNSGNGAGKSVIRDSIVRGEITNVATPNRSGVIGGANATFANCAYNFWDTTSDGGSAPPLASGESTGCQEGHTATELKTPEKRYLNASYPYGNYEIYSKGTIFTSANQDEFGFPDCALSSGSDYDFGFAMCFGVEPGYDTQPVWQLNSSTEYNTLVNLPNPSRQAKN
jgi:hypothetical protein